MKYFNGVPLDVEITGCIDNVKMNGIIVKELPDNQGDTRLSFCQNKRDGSGRAAHYPKYNYGWIFRSKKDGSFDNSVSDIKLKNPDYDIF